MKNPIIQIKNLTKTFETHEREIDVIRGVDLDIYPGEFILIFGPSGCGKTTLLNLILGLEVPTSGEIIINGQNLAEFSPDDMSLFRRSVFGIVFQNAVWLKSFNILENVALPLYLDGIDPKEARVTALECLRKTNMQQFASSQPYELSGGEQQRVGLARALVNDSPIIVADEPTGNLDSKSGHNLMHTLEGLHNQKKTIILVTHNLSYLTHADRKVAMKDGQILGHFTGDALPKMIRDELEEEE